MFVAWSACEKRKKKIKVHFWFREALCSFHATLKMYWIWVIHFIFNANFYVFGLKQSLWFRRSRWGRFLHKPSVLSLSLFAQRLLAFIDWISVEFIINCNSYIKLLCILMNDLICADDAVKNAMPSYFNLPPLDVSVAFPQATPASTFPPCGKKFLWYFRSC